MTKYALLAVASLGCTAGLLGCQQGSGHAEAEYEGRPQTASTYNQPESTASQAGYTTSTFTSPYTLKQDSAYMMSPTATTTAGTLHSGDTVYLRSGTMLDTSATNGWVAAKTVDGRMIYVRAADLQMK